MINNELLNALAASHGFSPSYRASDGVLREAHVDSLITLLRAVGVPLSENPSNQELDLHLKAQRTADLTRPLPPCLVVTEGEEKHFPVHVHDGAPAHVWMHLEDGTDRDAYQDENFNPPVTDAAGTTWGEATFHVPGDVPIGWHEVHLESDDLNQTCTLIVVPRALTTNQRYLEQPAWGVMAQLYSVRSEQSWGIGDFCDLADLAELLAAHGVDFLLINPVHAAEPEPPVENSPYLPTSRRFVNPIYIAVEDVDGFGDLDAEIRETITAAAAPLKEMNRSPEPIDRDEIYAVKLAALWELFTVSEAFDTRRDAFEDFIHNEGDGLVQYAAWCASRLSATGRHRVHTAENQQDTERFFMWLQFIADKQRRDAQNRARQAGMSIGIVSDLAVGVHPDGADANTLADIVVPDASVGAPPDQYTQQGQDWSQPPWNPAALAEAGYAAWRDVLRAALRHSGGIRVDHILGLFRLFWIPRLHTPAEGVYMQYDYEAMVGILALEAQRAGAVVIGEDLGTFEPWVQQVMRDKGIFGTSVLWFESSEPEGSPKHPNQYRNLCLTSVGTHDLPPTAGYLAGVHNQLRVELGLVDQSVEELNAADAQWITAVLDTARESGAFDGTTLTDTHFAGRAPEQFGDTKELIVGLNRFIASTPSALTCTNLVDMVGDRRIQNQPGTNADQYSNWCIPLSDGDGTPVLIEDLEDNALFKRVAAASARTT